MKHLVVAVSADSSLELLGFFADIIVLDKELPPTNLPYYDTLYIRSHFSLPALLPQNFRTEIDSIVREVRQKNPNIKFVDGTNTIEKILAFEDKWLQYKTFNEFMPKTQLLRDAINANFKRGIFKNRFSSRGKGVTWNIQDVTSFDSDWIIQESIDIAQELRVYIIKGEVYPLGAVRRSMTTEQNTQSVSSRELTQDEIEYASRISKQMNTMDMIGLDIALRRDGGLSLMEVNRSPGFGKFYDITNINLAAELYEF